MELFGEKLRATLKDLRLSQDKLAQWIGTSQSTVSSWITGGSEISTPFLVKVKRALGVSLDYLMDDDEPIRRRPEDLPEYERKLWELTRDLPGGAETVYRHAMRSMATLGSLDGEADPLATRVRSASQGGPRRSSGAG